MEYQEQQGFAASGFQAQPDAHSAAAYSYQEPLAAGPPFSGDPAVFAAPAYGEAYGGAQLTPEGIPILDPMAAAHGSTPEYGMQQAAYGAPAAHSQTHGMATVGMSPSKALAIIPLCRKGDRAGIERLIQSGASVHETDVEGNTPLHVAVEAPRNEIATVQCLLENGADANALNYIQATPLHYVCLRKSNYRGVANILLENGADINRQTVAGKSALHFACEKENPELVEVLCLFGSHTNLADTEGNMPIHLTLLRDGGRDTQRKQILEYLLSYSAYYMYANTEGLTPLHLAAQNGYIRCVQFLVERGAEVNVATLKGQTGLHLAALKGQAQIVQLLLNIFPQALDLQDVEGNTPLHCCALNGHLDSALVLLKMDANTTIRNEQKKTAFQIAQVRGTDLQNTHNPELVQVLKDARKAQGCRQS